MRLRHRLPPQSRLMQSIPSWVDPDALLAMQFGPDRYWRKRGGLLPATSVLATTRSSDIVLPNAAGVFQTLGNNVLPRTDRGLYVNGQFVNLVARLNPTVAQCPIRGNVSDAAGFAGFGNSIRFPGGVDAFAYQLPTIANGVPFAASFLVQMEDGNAPVFASASATNAANTFAIVVNGATTWAPPTAYSVTQVAAGIWRVSAIGTTPSTSTSFGIVQYNTNQNRAFRVCGYQLFAGSLVPDALVPGSSDTGGATLLASDIRAVQGIRPSNSQPEPCAGWEAAGLDNGFTVLLTFGPVLRNSGHRYLYWAGEESGTTSLSARIDVDGNLRLATLAGAANIRNNIPIGQVHRFANRFTRSGVQSFLSGGYSLTQAGDFSAALFEEISIGSQRGSQFLGGWIEELQICQPLSDAELLDWVNA